MIKNKYLSVVMDKQYSILSSWRVTKETNYAGQYQCKVKKNLK